MATSRLVATCATPGLHRNSAIVAPSRIKARLNRIYIDAGNFWRVGEKHFVASIGEPLIRPLISGLLLRRRPSAVSRAVAFVVINSVNRVNSGWTKPNVAKELLKRSIFKCNPSSTIIFVRRIFLACRSTLGGPVDRVLTRFRLPVRCLSIAANSLSFATTRFCSRSCQIITKEGFSHTAIANTYPSSVLALLGVIWVVFYDGQQPKSLAREINKSTISRGRVTIFGSHVRSFVSSVVRGRTVLAHCSGFAILHAPYGEVMHPARDNLIQLQQWIRSNYAD